MGNFSNHLKKPATEKFSTDGANDKLCCGTSSMQGWRLGQEDAHNCILDYDKDTSYFAVYDGHGGRAVSVYCSEELPKLLKELDEYKNGNLQKALEDAFLKFDATLPTEEVVIKLRKLANESNDEDVSDEEENIANLYEEATMPLDEVIEKYTSNPDLKSYLKTRKMLSDQKSPNDNVSNNSTTSTSNISENSSKLVSGPSCDSNNISSSDNSKLNDAKPENQLDVLDSHAICTSNKKTTEKDVSNQNGEVESKESCKSSKSDVITSSPPQENGEVVKKGKGKALTKTKGVVTKPTISQRPMRSAKQIYNSILSFEDGSEEESEDEKDETFEGPNDDSSDEDDNEAIAAAEDNSSSSAEEEEGEEDEEDEEKVSECDDEEEEEDDEDKSFEEFTHDYCGCTAIVALLRGNDLYVANAGDSRCVVSRNGKAIGMSIDHKPFDTIEKTRITKAGGEVTADGRVNGALNLSRAIGDHIYKQNKKLTDREQMITAFPDVKTLTINPNEDEFMILACDGIWDTMSNQDAVDFVRPKLQEGKLTLSQICEEMFDQCLAPQVSGDGTGCDNMTAIIVQFKSNTKKRSASIEPEEIIQQKKSKTEVTKNDVDECT